MRTGKLSLLIVVAAVAALAAFLLSRDQAARRADAAGEPVFAGLIDRVNDVAALVVTGPNGSATVSRDGAGWSVDALGGYAADAGTVGKVVLGVARLTLKEQMTSRPESHARLGVHEPGSQPLDPDAAPGTTGPVRLALHDADGGVLADLIVGDVRPGRPPSLYVRRAGEDTAWLAGGELAPPALPVGWVDASCVDIGPERFRSVTITHVDGETVSVARSSKAETEWGLVGLPAGRKEAYGGVGRSVGGALQRLSFEDVALVDGLAWPDDAETLTRFVGFDGFVVEARTADVDGRKWTRFAAGTEFAEPLPPEPDAAAATPAADDAGTPEELAAAEAAAADAAAQAVSARDLEIARRERLAAEAEAFTARHAPWAYALPEWKLTNLIKRMDDLTRAVDPPPPPAPSDPGEQGDPADAHAGHDHGDAADDG